MVLGMERKEPLFVCKFGGSSLASPTAVEKTVKLVYKNPARKYIVVSALGKDEKNGEKLTDTLYKIYRLAKENKEYKYLSDGVCRRFSDLERAFLGKSDGFKREETFFNPLWGSMEFFVSRGEFFTAELLSKILSFPFIDAFGLFVVRRKNIDWERTKKSVAEQLTEKSGVIPGFYGRDERENVRLLQRGGGDISGATLARAVFADAYEIFTDVDGVYTKNPNVYKDAKLIENMTYNQYFKKIKERNGVVHKACLKLLKKEKIPVKIGNTFSGKTGTIIR